MVNDASVSGVDSIPLGVDATGANAYLLTEREKGTTIVERYSIADGKREQVYADPDVDPIWAIRSLDGSAVIGAYFDPTRPRAVLWDAAQPDVPALRQILAQRLCDSSPRVTPDAARKPSLSADQPISRHSRWCAPDTTLRQ